MGEFSKFISPKRRSVPTPKHLVEDGKCVFGTFDKEFETMEFLKIKNPTEAPDFLNPVRLTLWEATEVHLKEGYMLTAVCNMGLFGVALTLFYDQRMRKLYRWSETLLAHEAVISPNLINGSVTKAERKKLRIHYINNFQDGKAQVDGFFEGKAGTIDYNFHLNRISKPSVVSIPFAEINERHRPLYTQKDFFKAEGYVTVNGKTYETTDISTAIIDDHRGYYPREMHYDWATFMGYLESDGKQIAIALNLTQNQSIDQADYNENLIWFDNEVSLLPPITFTKDTPTIDFDGHARWHIQDEHDMVNIDFDLYQVFDMVTHTKPVINIEYFIVFGEFNGYVRDENGKKYIFDHTPAMGEDKSVVF